jgi:hypothetical protein
MDGPIDEDSFVVQCQTIQEISSAAALGHKVARLNGSFDERN